jgi:hypothetical protein
VRINSHFVGALPFLGARGKQLQGSIGTPDHQEPKHGNHEEHDYEEKGTARDKGDGQEVDQGADQQAGGREGDQDKGREEAHHEVDQDANHDKARCKKVDGEKGHA